MTTANSPRFNVGKLFLILLSITIVSSLVVLYLLKSNDTISRDQYYYAFMLVLVGSAIISSVLRLSPEKFNLWRKVLWTAILLLTFVLLAVFVWNAFSEQWQSTAVIGGFGVTVVVAFWVLGFWLKGRK